MLSTNFSLPRVNVGHSMPAQTQRATGYVTSPKHAPVSDSFTLTFAGKGDEASKRKNDKSHPSHIQGGRYMASQRSRTPTAEEQEAYWSKLGEQDKAERAAARETRETERAAARAAARETREAERAAAQEAKKQAAEAQPDNLEGQIKSLGGRLASINAKLMGNMTKKPGETSQTLEAQKEQIQTRINLLRSPK